MNDQAKQVAKEWVLAQGAVAAYIGSLVRTRADRDDLLQQTALWLLEHAEDYQGRGFLSWAMQVARYRVLEHWNRQRRDQRVRVMAEVVELAFVHAEEGGAGSEASEARVAALQTCLQRLSADHRRLMQGRYVQERSLEEMSAQTGRTPQSLAVTYHRLRNALALCIRQRLQATEEGGIA